MRKAVTYVGTILAVTFFGIVGYAIYTVRSDVPSLGHTVLTTINAIFVMLLILVTVVLPIGLIGAAIYFVMRGSYRDIGTTGTIFQRLWHTKVFAPLAIAPPNTSIIPEQVNQEPARTAPRLADIISQGKLIMQSEAGTEMLRGYRALDSNPVYGSWPGVIAVSGGQNTGKSVTIATLSTIAAMQYARVVVCDTHHTKARSLYKKLAVLSDYITFARTEEQVLEQAEIFSQELANRKQGSEIYPYVFVLDEAASILKRSNVAQKVIPVIERASQEGHGYEMSVILGIHDFSNEGLGDVRIRDFIGFIYCHRMSQGQSKFIEAFKGRIGKKKIVDIIAELPSGHAVVRDEYQDIDMLMMPFVDASDTLVAKRELMQIGTPMRKQIVTGSLYEQKAEQKATGETDVKQEDEISEEDASKMHDAYLALLKVKIAKDITRTDILNACGWTRYKWNVVKKWCDARGVAIAH